MHERNKKKIFILLVVTLFFIAAIEILVLIFFRESWLDEEIYLFKSFSIMNGVFTPFKDIIVEYPPLFIPVYGIVQVLFGPSFYVGRAVSSVLFIALLLVTFKLLRRKTNSWWALAGIALILSDVFLVGNYVSATLYSLTALLLMLCLIYVERAAISLRVASLLGFLMGLLMLARINMLPAVILIFLFLFFMRAHGRNIAAVFAFFAITIVVGYAPIVIPNPSLALSYIVYPIRPVGLLNGLTTRVAGRVPIIEFASVLVSFLHEYYAYIFLFFTTLLFLSTVYGKSLYAFAKKEKWFSFMVVLDFAFLLTHYFNPHLIGSVYYANYFIPVIVVTFIYAFHRFIPHKRFSASLVISIIVLNGCISAFRTDVISDPRSESDLKRVSRGAELIKKYTTRGDTVLTFDNSVYHVFVADRKVLPFSINRDFHYINIEDKPKAERLLLYNFSILSEKIRSAKFVALNLESWKDLFIRANFYTGHDSQGEAKAAEIENILAKDFVLMGSAHNVYPRKYTDGNDGGTLLLYKHR
ncbi:hypothetical protein KW783_00040 [Candidatus Parcubacteria bacterium]|nr:hypothetical protein [Candidatus Parcubacteria bacterium]